MCPWGRASQTQWEGKKNKSQDQGLDTVCPEHRSAQRDSKQKPTSGRAAGPVLLYPCVEGQHQTVMFFFFFCWRWDNYHWAQLQCFHRTSSNWVNRTLEASPQLKCGALVSFIVMEQCNQHWRREEKQTQKQIHLPRKCCEAQPEGMLLPKTCLLPLESFFSNIMRCPAIAALQTAHWDNTPTHGGARRSIHLQSRTTPSTYSRGEQDTYGYMSLND